MTTEQETLRVMEAMKQTSDRRMFERYQVIHLYLKGFQQKDISEIVLRSKKTISSYIKAYKQGGLDGLERGLPTGAPRKLTETQEHELVQVVAYQTPHDVGYENHYNWTLAIISAFIQREWNQTYSLRGVSLLLEDLGFSHTRPTYTLKKADKAKQEVFKNETFPALKKTVK
ncbi:hypothetical protein J11TS1_19650 [Oceanobacillus sp. J11TS1]|nr:hypothetical protein J11TS1_19650 [Oceanobacillus sp. J11TS1]